MDAVITKDEGAAPATISRPAKPANKRNDNDGAESVASLLRASLVLRGIRQRYETSRSAYPEAHGYSVHVAIDSGDMGWITAAIESLERALARAALRPTRTGKRHPVAVIRLPDKNLAEETVNTQPP